MPDAEEDLNAPREDVISDGERLAGIEREKGTLAPDDPRVAKLSAEAQRLGQSLGSKTAVERQLADEIAGRDPTG